MTKQLWTAEEVADILSIAKGSVYNLVSQGKLPAIKIFGALRFDPDQIEEVIERGRIPTRNGDHADHEKNPPGRGHRN